MHLFESWNCLMMMIDMLSIHFLLKKIKEMETVDVKTFVKLEATPLNLPDVFKRKNWLIFFCRCFPHFFWESLTCIRLVSDPLFVAQIYLREREWKYSNEAELKMERLSITWKFALTRLSLVREHWNQVKTNDWHLDLYLYHSDSTSFTNSCKI